MKAPVAVFYLITSTNIGGAEKALLQLIRTIDRREFSVYVCSVKKPGAFARALAAEADGFFTLNLAEDGRVAALINFFPGVLHLITADSQNFSFNNSLLFVQGQYLRTDCWAHSGGPGNHIFSESN